MLSQNLADYFPDQCVELRTIFDGMSADQTIIENEISPSCTTLPVPSLDELECAVLLRLQSVYTEIVQCTGDSEGKRRLDGIKRVLEFVAQLNIDKVKRNARY